MKKEIATVAVAKPLSNFQFLVDTGNPGALDSILKSFPPKGMSLLVKSSDDNYFQVGDHYVAQGPDIAFLKSTIRAQGYGVVVMDSVPE